MWYMGSLLLYVIGFFISSPGWAYDFNEGRLVVETLMVRSGPSERNPVLCKLEKKVQSNYSILERNSGWYKLNLSHVPGCSAFPETWVKGEPHFEVNSGPVIRVRGGVIIRDRPGHGLVLCKLLYRAPVKVIIERSIRARRGRSINYFAIDLADEHHCRGNIGFVQSDYLVDVGEVEGASIEQEEIQEILGDQHEETLLNIEELSDDNDLDIAGIESDIFEDWFNPKPIQQSLDPRLAFTEFINSSQSLKTEPVVSAGNDRFEIIKNHTRVYSEAGKVALLIEKAKRFAEAKSKRLCLTYVKLSLAASNLVHRYLDQTSAKDAGKELEKEGFVNLMRDPYLKRFFKSPYDAPKGAIIVYNGYQQRHRRVRVMHGHIEIKIGDVGEGGFVSDFERPYPRTCPYLRNPEECTPQSVSLNGRGRYVTGIYVKLDDI